MAKQTVQRSYTFVNPNTLKEFERQLQKVLIDRLLYQHRSRAADGRQKGATDK